MTNDGDQFIPLGKRLHISYKTVGFQQTDEPPSQEPSVDDGNGRGVRFVIDRPLETGTQLDVLLRLPNRRDPLQFRGEVVVSQPAAAAGPQDESEVSVSVRFVRIDPKDRDFLLQYGRLYGP